MYCKFNGSELNQKVQWPAHKPGKKQTKKKAFEWQIANRSGGLSECLLSSKLKCSINIFIYKCPKWSCSVQYNEGGMSLHHCDWDNGGFRPSTVMWRTEVANTHLCLIASKLNYCPLASLRRFEEKKGKCEWNSFLSVWWVLIAPTELLWRIISEVFGDSLCD